MLLWTRRMSPLLALICLIVATQGRVSSRGGANGRLRKRGLRRLGVGNPFGDDADGNGDGDGDGSVETIPGGVPPMEDALSEPIATPMAEPEEPVAAPVEEPAPVDTPPEEPAPVDTPPEEPAPAPVDNPPEEPAPEEFVDDTVVDEFNDDGLGGFEGWNEPTESPVEYVAPDDDPFSDEFEQDAEMEAKAENEWNNETPEEMVHDRNVLIVVGTVCGVALLLMVATAQQMMENPDGCWASCCRCAIIPICCIFKTVCFPCRMICCIGGDRKQYDNMRSEPSSTFRQHDLDLEIS